jgi:hypothetical protein
VRWDFIDNSYKPPTPHRFCSGYIVLKASDETELAGESTDLRWTYGLVGKRANDGIDQRGIALQGDCGAIGDGTARSRS